MQLVLQFEAQPARSRAFCSARCRAVLGTGPRYEFYQYQVGDPYSIRELFCPDSCRATCCTPRAFSDELRLSEPLDGGTAGATMHAFFSASDCA